MPHSFGYRARTRDMFARDFGKNGVNELSIYLRKYKVIHHKLPILVQSCCTSGVEDLLPLPRHGVRSR